jgi:hypothetical protein
VVLGALGILGCKDLTSVDVPDVIQAEDYENAGGAYTLAVGAVTQFAVALGENPGQVSGSGLMADELMATFTNPNQWVGLWDSRASFDPAPETWPYDQFHNARQRLLTAAETFERVAPDSTARIGQLRGLIGYMSIFFGENYCSGVPLSHRDASSLRAVYGQPQTTAQLFDSALAAFDGAMASAAGSARELNMARIGRGRALLNQGRFSEAATAVASVPTEYVYEVHYTNTFPIMNTLFGFGSPQGSITVPEQEGTNGINWRSANDPRVPLINRSPDVMGDDGETEVWSFAAYNTADAPIRLATGIEARLIEAEAALQAGDAVTWLAIHNTLRATVPGLSPLADPGIASGRVDLHFRERAFWLFLTGHRHGDLRRLVRQYGRSADTVLPIGPYRDSGQYGPAVNMSMPAIQSINPHYVGCLDRNA